MPGRTVDDAVTPRAPRRGRPGYDRDQVQAIAVELFIERGYDATSVADLATRLNVTKSALYHHVDSKEQLLAAALDAALSGLERVLERVVASPASATEQIGMLVRGAVEVLVAQLPAVTLLLRVRGNSDVERAALERRRQFDQRVVALMARAREEGGIRGDVDAAIATRLVFGMINSVVEWYRPEGERDPEALAEDILHTAMDGLRVRPAASA